MNLVWREEPRSADREAVRAMVVATGFFTDAEADVAVELVDERLRRGLGSGYRFLFAERDGAVVAYSCYGEIACTVGSYDLYWIVVAPQQQRAGLGLRVLAETEARIRALGGRRVYIETSGRAQYAPTQGFYRRAGYALEAELADFYAAGDAKQIYVKAL